MWITYKSYNNKFICILQNKSTTLKVGVNWIVGIGNWSSNSGVTNGKELILKEIRLHKKYIIKKFIKVCTNFS